MIEQSDAPIDLSSTIRSEEADKTGKQKQMDIERDGHVLSHQRETRAWAEATAERPAAAAGAASSPSAPAAPPAAAAAAAAPFFRTFLSTAGTSAAARFLAEGAHATSTRRTVTSAAPVEAPCAAAAAVLAVRARGWARGAVLRPVRAAAGAVAAGTAAGRAAACASAKAGVAPACDAPERQHGSAPSERCHSREPAVGGAGFMGTEVRGGWMMGARTGWSRVAPSPRLLCSSAQRSLRKPRADAAPSEPPPPIPSATHTCVVRVREATPYYYIRCTACAMARPNATAIIAFHAALKELQNALSLSGNRRDESTENRARVRGRRVVRAWRQAS